MNCPYCRSENQAGATRCAKCTSWMTRRPVREWERSRQGALIAGVCRGIANQLTVPVAAVRLSFLLGLFLWGWGLIAYVFLWVAMPREQLMLPPATRPAEASATSSVSS